MQNVIAFPRTAVSEPVHKPTTGAKTFFVHIKRSMLIMHLAAPEAVPTATDRVGKQV